jgi:general secretion pathway protein H
MLSSRKKTYFAFFLRDPVRQRGMTLVEVLIVMVIISIVSSVAILTINHNQNTQYDNLAKQLTNILSLAEEEAMLKPTILGLAFTDTSFQFYEYDDSKKSNPWQPVKNKELGLHHLPDNTAVTVRIRNQNIPNDKNNETPNPHLIISTSGDIIPFILLIGKPGSKPRYQVVGEANGSLSSGPIP